MLYNCSIREALKWGGPITQRFIEASRLPTDAVVSIDSRSHMLMRGWYPAIPGWHHDDVDRGASGQPDYDAPLDRHRAMAAVCVDASDQPTGSMTEFLSGVVSVPWPVPEDAPVYRYWDAHIEREVTNKRIVLASGQIQWFTCSDFHRAMPATSGGWRWFGRITLHPGPRPAEGKVRRQAQVYLPVTNNGW
jgi:hypothetical protein